MSIVAVAGGQGDLGRTIIEAILQFAPQHQVVVLTRKGSSTRQREGVAPLTVPILPLDYSSPEQIAKTLSEYAVDTVISTVNLDFEAISDAQINLIRGAAQSGIVKRFIPSDFNVDYSVSDDRLPYPEKKYHQRARAELEKHPEMTFCSIQVGMFSDYYGIPHCDTYLKPLTTIVDIPFAKAAIPGDGEAKIAFTYARDMARYVAALLDVPAEKWPKDAAVWADKLTANELVKLAKNVTMSSFDVVYDPIPSLLEAKVTELPSNIPLYEHFPEGKSQVEGLACSLGIGIATGVYDIQGVSLNDMFPHIRPINMRDFLTECWKGKDIAT